MMLSLLLLLLLLELHLQHVDDGLVARDGHLHLLYAHVMTFQVALLPCALAYHVGLHVFLGEQNFSAVMVRVTKKEQDVKHAEIRAVMSGEIDFDAQCPVKRKGYIRARYIRVTKRIYIYIH